MYFRALPLSQRGLSHFFFCMAGAAQIVLETALSSCSHGPLTAPLLTDAPWAPYPDCHALCRPGACRGTHACSRELCPRLRGYDYARAGDAVLQFDAMPLARSSPSGLLQEHAVHSRCLGPAISCAERFILIDRARDSAVISPVRNLWLIFPRHCRGRSCSSVLRKTSGPAFAHLASPPIGFPT
jgi:hypothetical protein